MKPFFKDLWALTKPFWTSSEKWKAYLLLAVIIGLNLGEVYLNVRFNYWNNDFYNSLQDMDQNGFWDGIMLFSILATFYIIVVVYKIYFRQMLEVKWRRWMTHDMLGRWMGDQAYYRLQVLGNPADNPDQRIADDAGQFIALTLGLTLGLLSAVVTLFSFLGILWNLSGVINVPFNGTTVAVHGYLVWVALVYAIIGTAITHWIGRPLVKLNFDQERFEADFRFSLVRLRENTESVAFYRGEQEELGTFRERFAYVFDNFWQIMKRQKKLTWFTAGYGQIAIIFPYVVVAPGFFSGKLKLGDMMQTASAFGKVSDSLSFIIDAYTSLAKWRAVIERLAGFTRSINAAQDTAASSFKPQFSDNPAVDASGVTLSLPDGRVLQQGIGFTVPAGGSLLIQGPSGSGKSTLLRAMAGIWPYAAGNINLPANSNALFIPQKPYLPLGTLRHAMLYPKGSGATDDELRAMLDLCRLPQLKERLDDVQSWSHVLSVGEQQRIAFARALLAKHDLLFLDEATSALDEDNETYFYTLLRERLPKATIISIGHRPSLRQWHNETLDLGRKKSA
ncbi:MAG: ABC transporter ATP-binding protein/permease [Alphaproteobacteria bacterium]